MSAIYGLADPGVGRVRYVGATSTDVRRRVGRLISSARIRGDRYPVCDWLRSFEGWPDIIVLEQVGHADLGAAERWWINFLRNQGAADLNVLRGGNGLSLPRAVHSR